VARAHQVRYAPVLAWATRYASSGLELLPDRPRSGRPLARTGPERAKRTALACSPAPDGHRHWARRLLAGQAVERGYCRALSVGATHAMLTKTRASPSASARGTSGG